MKTNARPIVITGFMGAGKSIVASALAERLRCPVIDLDHFIAEREGRTPQAIIDEDGEMRFRELETLALRAALESDEACVLALGGGTWTIEHNRALIRERARSIVWLDAPFELCWRRIESSVEERPLARDRGKARKLYDERHAHYGCATLRVEVDGRQSPQEIAELLIRVLAIKGE